LNFKSRFALGERFLRQRCFHRVRRGNASVEHVSATDQVTLFASDNWKPEHLLASVQLVLGNLLRYHETAQLRHTFLAVLDDVRHRLLAILLDLVVGVA
jgi:hypothetical protein